MTTRAMTPWLRHHLISQGVIGLTGTTTRARLRTCRTCRLPILAGLDDSRLEATADPAELHAPGELAALLEGRRTWDLHWNEYLTVRGPRRIAWNPAGANPDRPVLAEHRCRSPVPADWTIPPPPDPPAAHLDPTSEEFPF